MEKYQKIFKSRIFSIPIWVWITIILLTIIKLWMVNDQPISALGEAGHDDRLFINLARNIINSEWLGDYDQLTLAKGSFYPMWIAAIFFTSIPLLLSQQLLYIFACLVAAIAIKPLSTQ